MKGSNLRDLQNCLVNVIFLLYYMAWPGTQSLFKDRDIFMSCLSLAAVTFSILSGACSALVVSGHLWKYAVSLNYNHNTAFALTPSSHRLLKQMRVIAHPKFTLRVKADVAIKPRFLPLRFAFVCRFLLIYNCRRHC